MTRPDAPGRWRGRWNRDEAIEVFTVVQSPGGHLYVERRGWRFGLDAAQVWIGRVLCIDDAHVLDRRDDWCHCGATPAPERAHAIWANLVDFERDVLTGKVTGWGAAIGQACEVLRSRRLFDASNRPTPLGMQVIAMSIDYSEVELATLQRLTDRGGEG